MCPYFYVRITLSQEVVWLTKNKNRREAVAKRGLCPSPQHRRSKEILVYATDVCSFIRVKEWLCREKPPLSSRLNDWGKTRKRSISQTQKICRQITHEHDLFHCVGPISNGRRTIWKVVQSATKKHAGIVWYVVWWVHSRMPIALKPKNLIKLNWIRK